MTVKTVLNHCCRWTGDALTRGWLICRKFSVYSRRWWRQWRSNRTR